MLSSDVAVPESARLLDGLVDGLAGVVGGAQVPARDCDDGKPSAYGVKGDVGRHGLVSFEQLMHQVRVTAATAKILTISVTAHTATQAQAAANDVALGDLAGVNSPRPGYPLRAVVMDPGAPPAATGTTTPSWVAGFAMLGALAGAGLMIMWRSVLPR